MKTKQANYLKRSHDNDSKDDLKPWGKNGENGKIS